MQQGQDIILVVDYHAENIEFRWFNEATGEERTGKYATTRAGILRQLEETAREVTPGGRVPHVSLEDGMNKGGLPSGRVYSPE